MITIDAGKIEASLLLQLEESVRVMFKFSGWDDCDDEPAEAVSNVREAVRNLDEFRRIVSRATQGKESSL